MTGALLDPQQALAVQQRGAALEAATGVEAVTAVIARADSYPEIPWKAFALGTSVAALAMTASGLHARDWEAAYALVETATVILAAGATAAIATLWIAPFARLFLPRHRSEGEVLQYAQALFLEAGLFRTTRRDGILLLVSRFERQVAVIADLGIREKVGGPELDAVVAAVTAQLARGNLQEALVDGLDSLEKLLISRGFRPLAGKANEIPDSVIQRGLS